MHAITRSEWLKVRSNRAVAGLLAGGLLYAVLNGVATAAFAGRDGNAPLGTGANLANILRGGGVATWVALLVGILSVTSEYRDGTIVSTFLASPRRGAVVAAKLRVTAVLGAGYAVLSVVAGAAGAAPRLLGGGVALDVTDAAVLRAVVGTVVATVLFGLGGVGIGALVRNQTAAVAGALIWFLPAENIAGSVAGWDVARWFPGQAAAAAAGAGGTTLLPPLAGAALFAGYALVAALAGTTFAISRDVT
jgi:hypothetical protein